MASVQFTVDGITKPRPIAYHIENTQERFDYPPLVSLPFISLQKNCLSQDLCFECPDKYEFLKEVSFVIIIDIKWCI